MNKLIPYRLLEDNSAVGPMFRLSSTAFSVLVAFLAIQAITNFKNAEQLVAREAAAVRSIYASATSMPPVLAAEIQNNILAYIECVVTQEWPAMQHGKLNLSAAKYLNIILDKADDSAVNNPVKAYILGQIVNTTMELDEIHQARAGIINISLDHIAWIILIFISILTIASNLFYTTKSKQVKYAGLTIVSLIIASAIFLVFVFDRPYQGQIAVSSAPLLIVIDEIKADE